jgi:hypothetical protein
LENCCTIVIIFFICGRIFERVETIIAYEGVILLSLLQGDRFNYHHGVA